MPGQTIEDIARAEAIFIEKVTALHPKANGKPCVIGNCQAGWAVMMLAAVRPELFGPIIIAGSPLSYWAGVHGKYPMRYSGGLLGGSWLTALTSDLGHGKFDGAWLVQNFENQNPANTLWTKQYNLYSKIDTEAPRYLGFERWWGGHVNLNAEEIQFIVDELFVGNKLAAGMIQTSDGVTVDLRNIRSPIVVFCSKGDNVTPPQQALDWILDLYENVDEIRSYGQTIVYTIHETIGHLGIFVSGGVARKEHDEFSSNIDLIDTLPPGLYEAVLERKTDDTANPDLATGNWVMRCEARTLDDIRALGGNDAADERRFATAARVSETNLALYRTYAQPMVRAIVNSPMADWLHQMHPLRLQYELISDANPMMAWVGTLAEQVRKDRRPVAAGQSICRDAGEHVPPDRRGPRRLAEYDRSDGRTDVPDDVWHADPAGRGRRRFRRRTVRCERPPKSPLHRELLQSRIADLKARMTAGGIREAVDPRTALCRHGRAPPSTSADSRPCAASGANTATCRWPTSRRSCASSSTCCSSTPRPRWRRSRRCSPPTPRPGRKAFELIGQVLEACGALSAEDKERMQRIEAAVRGRREPGNRMPFRQNRKELQAKAS